MQKWEYRVVGFLDITNHHYTLNGKKVRTDYHLKEEHRGSEFRQRVLSEMGEDGWELVALESALYIFKRPK